MARGDVQGRLEAADAESAGFILRFEPGFLGTLGSRTPGSGVLRAAPLEPRELERLEEIAAALFAEGGSDDPWRDALLGALVAELFTLCFRAFADDRRPARSGTVASGAPARPSPPVRATSAITTVPPPAEPDAGPWRIEDAVRWAAEHCAETHSLDFYVTRCATNPSDFSRRFKAVAGCPLFEYINRKRIERACVLLKTTERSILEVAFAVGYNNLSFFNRYFLRLMGLPPRAWREASRS